MVKMVKEGGSVRVRLIGLLSEGWNPQRCADYLKVSERAVSKHIRRYVAEGTITKIANRPAQYKVNSGSEPPLKLVGSSEPNKGTPFLPHDFRGIFTVAGKPIGRFNNRGKLSVVNPEYTYQISKYKAQIYLKAGFVGSTRDELIAYGRKRILELSKEVEFKHNVSLSLLNWYSGIHWVNKSTKESTVLATGEHITKGETKLVLGASWTYENSSHPNLIEIHPAAGYPKETPTSQVGVWEWYLKNHPSLAEFVTLLPKYSENIEKHLAVLDEMSLTMKDIREALKDKRDKER